MLVGWLPYWGGNSCDHKLQTPESSGQKCPRPAKTFQHYIPLANSISSARFYKEGKVGLVWPWATSCLLIFFVTVYSRWLQWDLQRGQLSRQKCQIQCFGLDRNNFLTGNHPWNCSTPWIGMKPCMRVQTQSILPGKMKLYELFQVQLHFCQRW